MLVLAFRTDKPDAELILLGSGTIIGRKEWRAHRALAATLHNQIRDLLNEHKVDLERLTGIIVYSGPGSFTGLRIGASVANALAYSLEGIKLVSSQGDNWIEQGLSRIERGKTVTHVVPDYGSQPHVTTPKK
jgi:tRNA threonylcarbamoyladenosine biosynthesis protein TsaB